MSGRNAIPTCCYKCRYTECTAKKTSFTTAQGREQHERSAVHAFRSTEDHIEEMKVRVPKLPIMKKDTKDLHYEKFAESVQKTMDEWNLWWGLLTPGERADPVLYAKQWDKMWKPLHGH